ncbi:nucleoside triphosphatase [Schizosaccharomyces japonicus yFS275]|uniref:Inosine triphosphate pyrophosphatase n=1 Tax=Schizosaccharomyces japonicus (strain yFS275 / FY16936) TaxID=402676 RepID=B6K531_SCHJY|nr:nucleoside triphosphatase [Schizosaccharomyces japonicus yFS275]EEB08635.2 nucleoside triphosphatase [Schizosaccharomyces japonicus yFS275]
MSKETENPTIVFVTGNKMKLREVKAILGNEYEVVNHKYDLPEIQGSTDEVTIEKCRTAAEIVKGPVIVEDTWLGFNAMNGLPGAYIKWFYQSIGCEGLYKMLAGFEDKGAVAGCTFGYCEGPGHPVQLFRGEVDGTIVSPTGEETFGWNPVFKPNGFEQTYAEMDDDVKNSISHRYKACMKLRDFLQEKARQK